MTPGFTGPYKGQPQPGTLFDKRALDQLPGNIEATRNRPGPRGYSPARLADVRNNFLAKVEVGVNMNETGHLYGPSHYDPHADPGGPIANRARSRMLDTLARSTIPTDEMNDPLAGLHHVRVYSKPPFGVPARGEYMSSGTRVRTEPVLKPEWRGQREPTREATIGLYNAETDSYGLPMGSTGAAKGRDPQAEQTFLHEVGHHDSYIAATESSRYETKAQQAEEEARADRFAVKHFRSDPRNKEPYDPREHTYMGRQLLSRFEGYQDWYRQKLPAEMRPPAKTPRNLGRQFEQPELEPAKGRHVVGDIFTEPGVENPRGWTR